MKPSLTVTFLGTGTSQGIPVIGSDHPVCQSTDLRDKRLRVSVLLQWKDKSYVVDCGPDFRQQMLRTGVSRLDGILLTHEHSDHTAGLDDIRPFYFRQGEIPFYAEQRVFDALHDRFAYIFETVNKYPGAPAIREELIAKGQSFELDQMSITPVEVLHGDLPVLGFRVGDFVYLTDAKTMSEDQRKLIRGCEVLVVNALRKEPHYTHFNLDEALEFVADIQPRQAYFTHISHLMGFHAQVDNELPDHVNLAYDGLTITI
ncbi:MBL fold metallo-hydrolase [Aureitalea marina]|uniref:MBL fold metallo-hydrolase n=1 Tax=Aureitalea marina TaxID=930804 RepID=A0A2S7KPJ5_9FLAO|nr:MBL fold metallo-hydrolase [Aureitalea marina]PQB04493.1 MBL fold metallo-hydrolase [Aureitalea marina]